MKNNKNSIISASAFALSFLCGVLSFGILFAEPMREIVEYTPLLVFFVSIIVLNILFYISAWWHLVKALIKKESAKVVAIIFSVFSLVNFLYIYMSIGALVEWFSQS